MTKKQQEMEKTMSRSKTKIPKNLESQCKIVIHTATTAATAAGAFPIPISDTIPITAAQVTMIVALGKIFDMSISESAAKSIAGVTLAQSAGRAAFSGILKMIPGAGSVIGGIVGAVTASALTETLGWSLANDFYKMSIGEEPENLAEAAEILRGAFEKR